MKMQQLAHRGVSGKDMNLMQMRFQGAEINDYVIICMYRL